MQVNIIVADALAPCIARSSAPMILNVCNMDILVIIGSEFEQSVTFQCWAVMWNANVLFYIFSEKNQQDKGLVKN